MKYLLCILLFSTSVLACEQVDIVGKIASDRLQTLPDTKAVVVIDDFTNDIYVVRVDNGNYAVSLPGCTRYTIGSPSVRGYYFKSAVVTVTENIAYVVNFIGIPSRVKRK